MSDLVSRHLADGKKKALGQVGMVLVFLFHWSLVFVFLVGLFVGFFL